ncbi:hypothetical protein HDU99_001699 [Rhizoclosmatium hyalinum]|nr:hypothetical protein HDU99_001699 [Rhizoclosmatium hyalinum]
MATDSTKLATKYESDSYKVLKHSRIFQQSFDLVLEAKESVHPDGFGSSASYPFRFKLPRNDMPPSFEHPSGSVTYHLKAIVSFYEGKNFTKTTLEKEIPITIIMPESARLKFLQNPIPVDKFVVASPSECAYSLQIPTTVVTIGDVLEVNLVISSTPENARLRSMSASLNIAAGFSSAKTTVGWNHKSTNEEATYAHFPRPVAEVAENFQLLKVGGTGGVEPLVRRIQLPIDPQCTVLALTGFDSVNTLLRLQITTVNSDVPNIYLEVPIIVLPQPRVGSDGPAASPSLYASSMASSSPSLRGGPPSPHSSPSLRPTPSLYSQTPRQYYSHPSPQQQPMYQVPMPGGAMPGTPPLSPTNPILPPPAYDDSPYQAIREQQAKLASEMQKLDLNQTQFPARTVSMARSASQSSAFRGGRPRTQSIDAESVLSQYPANDWTVDMVADWLFSVGATEEVVQTFRSHDVDGSVLVTLTADDLRNELNVVQIGVRRKILMAIEKLRG